MEITYRCAACGAPFKVAAQHVGRKAKCPHCAQITVVTPPPPPVVEPPPVEPPPVANVSDPRARFTASPVTDDQVTSPDIPAPTLGTPAGGGVVINHPTPAPAAGVAGTPGAAAPVRPRTVSIRPPAASPGARFAGAPASKPVAAPPPAEPPAEEEAFPLKTAPSAGVRRPQRAGKSGRGNGSGKRLSPLAWVIVGGGIGLVVAVGCLVGIVMSLSGDSSAVARVAGRPKLIVELPSDGRRDIKLLVDERPQTIPTAGPVELIVEEGMHQLTIQRRGYQQVDHSFTLRKGEQLPFRPTWERTLGPADPPAVSSDRPPPPSDFQSGPPGFAGWLQNLEVAQKQAREKKRDIFLVFSGSDWSNQTKAMVSEVFGQPRFRSFAEQRFVLLVVDLPRTESGINQLENIQQNRNLSLQFGIRSVPTILLLDASGTPYAADGFFGDGLDKYIQHITLLQNKHAQRDVRLAAVEAAKSKSPAERLAALEQAVQWLDAERLTPHYGRMLAQWVAVARQLDPMNQLGKLEVLFEADWIARLNSALVERERAQVVGVIADLFNWSSSHKFLDPNRAVRIHTIAVMLLLNVLDDPATAARHVALAKTYEPDDAKLRQELADMENWLRRKDQLSSGTGFMVGADGYVLTNHHVIEGPGKTMVRVPTQGGMTSVPATTVAVDPQQDIALLKVDPQAFPRFTALTVSPDRVRRGSEVAVFGFPLGDDLGKDVRITTGVVHSPAEQSEDKRHVLDCRINPGNSGGPVLNRYGRVIGMVTAKTIGGNGVDSYGVAVPAPDLQAFLSRHLPGYVAQSPGESAGGEPGERLEWERVDELVAPSVLMVLKVKDN
ncbi:MAG: trypsin-like peptidase domain-containing protein [Pirellulales bacterium]